MRWLAWAILSFAAAVGLALAARFNHGNVAVFWPPWRIDISVNLALVLLALAFVALHLFLVGLSVALKLPVRVREYRERQAAQRSSAALADALLAFFEGRFGRAERLAQQVQAQPAAAGLAALIGARAAARMREQARSEQWLLQAEGVPALRAATLTTRAELATERRDATAALAAVEALHKGGARHIHALRIALRAAEQAGSWAQVLRLLPQLEKREALHPVVAQRLRVNAYRALFPAQGADLAELRKLWAGVPAPERLNAEIAGAAADAFRGAGDPERAARILEAALDHDWSEALVRRYAALDEVPPRERLARAESWQLAHGETPAWLRLMGELCLVEQLWGKAQENLERALARQPDAATHLALARLHEATGRPELAATHFRASALARH